MDLDELLVASAPPVTGRTPQLQRELIDLVSACEAAGSRRRRPARLALVGGAVAGILGVSAVASAAGVLPGWPLFATSSGATCEIDISASAMEPGDGERSTVSTFTAAERRETLVAARALLEGFDYASVDRDRAVAWWKAQESEARALQSDPAERQPKLAGDDLEVTAVSAWAIRQIGSDLAAQGYDIRAIDVATSVSGCSL